MLRVNPQKMGVTVIRCGWEQPGMILLGRRRCERSQKAVNTGFMFRFALLYLEISVFAR